MSKTKENRPHIPISTQEAPRCGFGTVVADEAIRVRQGFSERLPLQDRTKRIEYDHGFRAPKRPLAAKTSDQLQVLLYRSRAKIRDAGAQCEETTSNVPFEEIQHRRCSGLPLLGAPGPQSPEER